RASALAHERSPTLLFRLGVLFRLLSILWHTCERAGTRANADPPLPTGRPLPPPVDPLAHVRARWHTSDRRPSSSDLASSSSWRFSSGTRRTALEEHRP